MTNINSLIIVVICTLCICHSSSGNLGNTFKKTKQQHPHRVADQAINAPSNPSSPTLAEHATQKPLRKSRTLRSAPTIQAPPSEELKSNPTMPPPTPSDMPKPVKPVIDAKEQKTELPPSTASPLPSRESFVTPSYSVKDPLQQAVQEEPLPPPVPEASSSNAPMDSISAAGRPPSESLTTTTSTTNVVEENQDATGGIPLSVEQKVHGVETKRVEENVVSMQEKENKLVDTATPTLPQNEAPNDLQDDVFDSEDEGEQEDELEEEQEDDGEHEEVSETTEEEKLLVNLSSLKNATMKREEEKLNINTQQPIQTDQTSQKPPVGIPTQPQSIRKEETSKVTEQVQQPVKQDSTPPSSQPVPSSILQEHNLAAVTDDARQSINPVPRETHKLVPQQPSDQAYSKPSSMSQEVDVPKMMEQNGKASNSTFADQIPPSPTASTEHKPIYKDKYHPEATEQLQKPTNPIPSMSHPYNHLASQAEPQVDTVSKGTKQGQQPANSVLQEPSTQLESRADPTSNPPPIEAAIQSNSTEEPPKVLEQLQKHTNPALSQLTPQKPPTQPEIKVEPTLNPSQQKYDIQVVKEEVEPSHPISTEPPPQQPPSQSISEEEPPKATERLQSSTNPVLNESMPEKPPTQPASQTGPVSYPFSSGNNVPMASEQVQQPMDLNLIQSTPQPKIQAEVLSQRDNAPKATDQRPPPTEGPSYMKNNIGGGSLPSSRRQFKRPPPPVEQFYIDEDISDFEPHHDNECHPILASIDGHKSNEEVKRVMQQNSEGDLLLEEADPISTTPSSNMEGSDVSVNETAATTTTTSPEISVAEMHVEQENQAVTDDSQSVIDSLVATFLNDPTIIIYTLFCVLCLSIFKSIKWFLKPKLFELPTKKIEPSVEMLGSKGRSKIKFQLEEEVKMLKNKNLLLTKHIQRMPVIKGRKELAAKLTMARGQLAVLKQYNSVDHKNSELKKKMFLSKYNQVLLIQNFVQLEDLVELMRIMEFISMSKSLKESAFAMKVECDFLREQMSLFRDLTKRFREDYQVLCREIAQEKKKERAIEEEYSNLKSLCDELDLNNSIDEWKRKLAAKETETDRYYKDYINNYYCNRATIY